MNGSRSPQLILPRRPSRKGLRRQQKVDVSPNRSQQADTVVGQSTASRERRGGHGSPPSLNRPLSLPLDPRVGSDDTTGTADSPKSSSLQRYKDTGDFKEKAERWRERMSDESSPEVNRRQGKRREDFR